MVISFPVQFVDIHLDSIGGVLFVDVIYFYQNGEMVAAERIIDHFPLYSQSEVYVCNGDIW